MTKRRKRTPAKPDLPVEADHEAISAAVLEALPPETRTAYVQSISFRGPLPPPALLKDYDKVKPGLADTIVEMATGEQDHRHRWESSSLEAHLADRRLGLWLGFAITVIGAVAAVAVASLGHPWVAASALVPGLSGILAHALRRPPPEPD